MNYFFILISRGRLCLYQLSLSPPPLKIFN
ncbi:unnamed protein product [Nezara viridula]|uniref:Uncharacterized protein n=1 Tax=Nezara viridula TaxID=85310 RepID=A0A9P0HDC0_NEZVI|nr:unnamed protein product [Nezara viridula]